MRTDYVIEDRTDTYWPDVLLWRGPGTPLGRGYRTREDAERRIRRVLDHYAARHGARGGPDLRVVERGGKP